jgi:glycosyltransferase involved in cell wall biosynthesis
LRRGIAAFGPDVVHVQFSVGAFGSRTPALLLWMRRLRRDGGVPVIATMHEVTRDLALLRVAGPVLYRLVSRHCDRIIVHTDAARAALLGSVGAPPETVAVIPHPAAEPPDSSVGPAELRQRFGLSDAPILLAFGFVHVDKGLQDLVRAVSTLTRSGASPPGGLHVVIAGAVRRRNGLMRAFEARDQLHLLMVLAMARRLGVRDRLVLTGYVPDGEVTPWFRASAAAVLPYRRIEQSGVASLAIALGSPVLASQVGGLNELFADSQWTFPPGDPVRLAAAITDFLSTPAGLSAAEVQPPAGARVTAVAAATLDAYAAAMPGRAGGLTRVG